MKKRDKMHTWILVLAAGAVLANTVSGLAAPGMPESLVRSTLSTAGILTISPRLDNGNTCNRVSNTNPDSTQIQVVPSTSQPVITR